MKTIYLVEDDVTLAEGLASLLLDEGYEVKRCQDAASLQKKLAREAPDLIVMDYLLPGIDGITLASTLRKSRKWKHIPIILMSATTPMFMKKEESVKVDAFFSKPFEIDLF